MAASCSRSLLTVVGCAVCLLPGVDGFIPLSGPLKPTTDVAGRTPLERQHRSSRTARRACRRFAPPYSSQRQETLVMAAGGKKRRRRKETSKSSGAPEASAVAATQTPVAADKNTQTSSGDSGTGVGTSRGRGGSTVVEGAGPLGDVLDGDRELEELFTDDWSGMPANEGMTKAKVPLPDISTFKPSKRAETSLEEREKKSADGLGIRRKSAAGVDAMEVNTPVSLSGFKSKLPPIVDREEERLQKSAAERFDEGPIVKGLKTATWFSIVTLVAWEVYINSPWFHAPAPPPIT